MPLVPYNNDYRGSSRSVVVNVLDDDTVISEFKPQSGYQIYFGKGINPLIHLKKFYFCSST